MQARSKLQDELSSAETGQVVFITSTTQKRDYLRPFRFIVLFFVTYVTLNILARQSHTGSWLWHRRPHFGFDSVFDSSFQPLGFTANWLTNGDSLVLMNEKNDIVKVDAATTENFVLLNGNKSAEFKNMNGLSVDSYWVSADSKFVLLATNLTKVYRHSFTAVYYIYDVEAGTFKPMLAENPTSRLQYAAWSPNSRDLIYVIDNDLYALRNMQDSVRVTNNGQKNLFFNGIPDWVYEEEVLGTNSASWFSPQGRYVAYFSLNATGVPVDFWPFYSQSLYDELIETSYPKPGTKNTEASFWVFDTVTGQNKQFDVEAPFESYYTEVEWATEDTVGFRRMNRAQNESVLIICTVPTSHCSPLAHRVSSAWLDTYNSLTFFSQGGQQMLADVAAHKGYPHIALYTLKPANSAPVFLTEGDFEVISINGYSPATGLLYYTSTEVSFGEASPRVRHIWSVNVTDGHRQCVSCAFGRGYYSASFNFDASRFILNYAGPNVPTVKLVSTDLKNVVVLQANEKLQAALDNVKHTLPHRIATQIPTEGGQLLEATFIVPPDFDASGWTKYPVLVEVYGGPGSQKCLDTMMPINWHTYLASTHNYIIVNVDGRGTGARGYAHKNVIYRTLGQYETRDQLDAGRYLKTLPFVDADRVAIWGWSYGGYMTSMVIGNGTDVFRAGLAVAPVTDWHFYDSVYTERYMSTPQDNPEGYKTSSVLERASAGTFKAKYLLVHGTADDNVHFQNSAQLVSRLVESNFDFRTQFYTDKDHRIQGGNTQRHLYRLLTNFLQEALDRPARQP
eukprot:Colp12_sorted_trinity150504_noHs@18833